MAISGVVSGLAICLFGVPRPAVSARSARDPDDVGEAGHWMETTAWVTAPASGSSPAMSPRRHYGASPGSSHPALAGMPPGSATPKDNLFAVAIDESGGPGTGYDTVYADSNNDNRIDPATERQAFLLGSTSKQAPIYLEFRVVTADRPTPISSISLLFPISDVRSPRTSTPTCGMVRIGSGGTPEGPRAPRRAGRSGQQRHLQ